MKVFQKNKKNSMKGIFLFGELILYYSTLFTILSETKKAEEMYKHELLNKDNEFKKLQNEVERLFIRDF